MGKESRTSVLASIPRTIRCLAVAAHYESAIHLSTRRKHYWTAPLRFRRNCELEGSSEQAASTRRRRLPVFCNPRIALKHEQLTRQPRSGKPNPVFGEQYARRDGPRQCSSNDGPTLRRTLPNFPASSRRRRCSFSSRSLRLESVCSARDPGTLEPAIGGVLVRERKFSSPLPAAVQVTCPGASRRADQVPHAS